MSLRSSNYYPSDTPNNVVRFTSGGNNQYVPPASLKAVIIELLGGGGGTGGLPTTNILQSGVSQAAGSGAYIKMWMTRATLMNFLFPTTNYVNFSVGVGGAAGSISTSGGDGGPTAMSLVTQANGGFGGALGTVASSSGLPFKVSGALGASLPSIPANPGIKVMSAQKGSDGSDSFVITQPSPWACVGMGGANPKNVDSTGGAHFIVTGTTTIVGANGANFGDGANPSGAISVARAAYAGAQGGAGLVLIHEFYG